MNILPTDNDLGIPVLNIDMQAKVVAPVLSWGSRGRRSIMTGTWVFYVDDYRFTALEKDPTQLLATGCVAASELNFTLYDYSSKAETIWATYRKRSVARRWQDEGLPIFVDLNVPLRYMETSLIGVPKGWRSFSTRGYNARINDLKEEHKVAMEISNNNPTFLVFGGGAKVEELCKELHGAIYAPSHWETTDG